MTPMSAPWSTGQLKRLGKCIRDEQPIPGTLPPYDDVMAFYNDLAVETQASIESMDFTGILGDANIEVTSRSKTIDTLRQKLQRDRATPLSSIQDVAGVRFEAEMSLEQQDRVVQTIVEGFDHSADAVRDLRNDPHSGYRAVHVWLRHPARVEVQIRTHLQGAWANLYEVTADVIGRDIRYGHIPEDQHAARMVRDIQELSKSGIQQLEFTRGVIEALRHLIGQGAMGPLALSNTNPLFGHDVFRSVAREAKGGMVSLEDLASVLDAEVQRIEAKVSKGMVDMTDNLMKQGKELIWPGL